MENKNSQIQITDPNYWDQRYLDDNTGWDMHQPSPPLKSYIDTLEDKNLRILIPGCGNAHEARYLLEKGFKNVTLIDFSKVVTDRLKEIYKELPVQIINENFFEHSGTYDIILEQTFFCALPHPLQEKHPKKCIELLNKNGRIAGVFFNKKFADTEPPYIRDTEEYKMIFSPYFDSLQFADCKNSIAPRMGTELFFEFRKKESLNS
ncbi:MAG: methyltransferase domain-containing protein [Ginsengibacter sp.]